MRLKLAIVSLLAVSLWGQPTQSDRYQYAPLVATAKLWNLIRYLHPQLTGSSAAWDAALITALPKIEAAHSDEELAIALDAMLETLHDPCTRIAFGLPGKGVSVQSLDETMVIHANNGDMSGSMGAGLMLRMGIPQTSNIVWDLRGSRLPVQLSARPDLNQLSASGIGYSFREHSGYAPQGNITARYYSSSLQIVDAQPGLVKNNSSRRQVYLIDKDSAVPLQAIIDQSKGLTAIISEDPPREVQAAYTELVKVLGKVVAEVRLAELRYSDGTTNFAPTRVVLNRGEEAVKAAVSALTGPIGMPGERTKFQPGSSAFLDMPYAEQLYPGHEMRILAAMRIWGILHYFDPYVSMLGDKWDDVLIELLPKFSQAKDAAEYHLAVAEMLARSGDGGCSARSSTLESMFGTAMASFEVRFIENQPVITRIMRPGAALPGDVIVKIDGKPVQQRIDELSRYLPASAPAALLTKVAHFLLTAQSQTTMTLSVRGKDNALRDVPVTLNAGNQRLIPVRREGETVRLINERIGYADIESLESAELDKMFEKLKNTAAIIFDLRGYPRDLALSIAARLGDRNQPVVTELFRNIVSLVGGEGHINFQQSELRISPAAKQRYLGKTVALIDDLSPGISGESAMCLKAANQTVLIGSAAFPVFSSVATMFVLPGNIKVYFSGQIPRWPGGGLLYPEGVKPDVEVRPTIAGIRAGKDEVLDAAIAYLERKN